jgi:hypothetical protein
MRSAIVYILLLVTLGSCGIPTLVRSPLEFLGLFRFFNRNTQTEFSVGGAVSGLFSGSSITLTNNNESVTLTSDGNFTFPTKLKTGASYKVSFTTANSTGMDCKIADASGTVQTENITNVSIICDWGTDYFEVGVSVADISASITVQNNGSDSQSFSSAGLYKFSTRIKTGSAYAVTISSQTAGSVCAFVDPTLTVGTMGNTNVTIYVRCVTGYLSGGTIHSVAAANLVSSTISSQNYYLRTMVGAYPYAPGDLVNDVDPSLVRFNNPRGMASAGNFVYVADATNNLIRKIDKTNGSTTTFAGGNAGGGVTCPGTTTTNCKDGTALDAQFNNPFKLTTDGTNLYVLEFSGSRIRKINLATAAVTTLAGSGNGDYTDNANGILASFEEPHDITLYNGTLYVADRQNHCIRAVNPVTSAVSTFAGTGGVPGYADANGTSAQFNNPIGIVGLGGFLYVTDIGNERIRKISLSGSNPVTTIAGNGTSASVDGFGTSAQFGGPFSIATDGTDLFISDYNTYKIRHLRISDNKVTTLAGSGGSGYLDNVGSNALMTRPAYMISDGSNLYISDEANHSIRRLQNAEILRYTFDGNSDDSIGTNNGLWTGSPTSTSDENGNATGAYGFDGTTDYITSTTNVTFDSSSITDYLTISAWVHPNGGTTDQVIFSNGTIGTDGYALVFQASTRYLYIQVNGTASGISTNRIPLNQWSHVTIKSSNNTWLLSVNGVNQGIVFNATPNSLTNNFAVAYGGSLSHFKGKISDVRFFKGALDDNAIRKLAVQVSIGLVAYYPFNGNAEDQSGNFNHLTANGTTAISDRFNLPSSAYEFNGTTDFMEKSSPTGLPSSNASRTHCVWLRTYGTAVQNILWYGSAGIGLGSGVSVDSGQFSNSGYFSDHSSVHNGILSEWNHFCAIYDGATASNYVNGVFQNSSGKTWTTDPSATLQIGRKIDAADPFQGALDDIRIYNRALSSSEIIALSGSHPTQVSVWNYAPASSSLKLFLTPESATITAGICAGPASCIPTWNDRSGNGNNVSQGLGLRQPFFLASGINDAPAVRFVGSGATPAYLTAACSADMIGSTNTIFAVFSESSQSGNYGIFQNGAPNPPGPGGKLLYLTRGVGSNPTLFNLFSNIAVNQSTSLFNALNEPVILSLDYNGASGLLLKNGSIYPSSSSAAATFSCTGGNLEIGRYYFGGAYPADGGYFDGYIGDFIYFDQVLSASDRSKVECYLSSKYNIRVGHSCQ